jgi:hypothetical protein
MFANIIQMMILQQRISAFITLGQNWLSTIQNNTPEWQELCRMARVHNAWFEKENIQHQFTNLAYLLTQENLTEFTTNYTFDTEPKNVGIIAAGNIPIVAFHDLMCVLLAGHNVLLKLSSDDQLLMRYVVHQLQTIEPQFNITVTERLNTIDAVIATGSNNSARYFDYYFGKYPHIIRKNRNSVAVLTGNETNEELTALATDICAYFGLGCRNVSKVYLPKGYDLDNLFNVLFPYQQMVNNQKYGNNYDYNRALLMMKQVPFLENGFMVLKEDAVIATPVAILNYEYYTDITALETQLAQHKHDLQCIVAQAGVLHSTPTLAFGTTQQPNLTDYADDVDTLSFLSKL